MVESATELGFAKSVMEVLLQVPPVAEVAAILEESCSAFAYLEVAELSPW